MMRFRSSLTSAKLAMIAVAATIALMGDSTTARADFRLRLSEAGFADFETPTIVGGTTILNQVFGNYTISFTAVSSNTPGLSTLATLNLTSVVVYRNNTASGTAAPLVITVSATNYSSPSPPVTLDTAFSYNTATIVGPASISESSYLDPSNTLYGQPAGTSLTGFTNAALSGSASDSSNLSLSPINYAGLYSLTHVMSITLSTQGSSFANNLNSGGINSEVVNAVPAPSSAILALASLPIIGLFGFARRRRQHNAASACSVA